MSLSIGIVGLPNVGKSTLFNALLKKQVALAANYPFATIEPNVGIAEVPDARLSVLAKVVKTQVIKPATVEFVDIAGLVKGASEGEGLGNQFLSHIRSTAAICHVLRDFTDPDIIREGSLDPQTDLGVIRTELQLADLVTLTKQKEPKGRVSAEQTKQWATIGKLKKSLDAGDAVSLNSIRHDEAAAEVAAQLCLLSLKPEIFALNVAEADLKKSEAKRLQFAKVLAVKPEQVVVVSAQVESELAALGEEDQRAYLADLGISQSGLERLASTAYATLALQSFLTAGEKEVRAWTIRQGATAVEAAGVIHTDFVKNFIKAKITSFADFVKFGGWKAVKEAGKLRLEGRDYVMNEGDVVEFMIGN